MNNQDDNNTSLFDLIFNIALGVCLMFMVSVLIMRVGNKKSLKTKAEFTIILTWQDGVNHDVDLWIRDPQKNVTSFRSKENGITHLDRDDLGMVNDYYVDRGVTVYVETNQEIATIRGFMAGEWVVNTHFYRADKEDAVARCRIQVMKLNPVATIVLDKQFVLHSRWQEMTIAQLIMGSGGNVIDIHEDVSIPLVQTFVEQSIQSGGM